MKKIGLIIMILLILSNPSFASDYFVGIHSGVTDLEYNYFSAKLNNGILFGIKFNDFSITGDIHYLLFTENSNPPDVETGGAYGWRYGINAIYYILKKEFRPFIGLSATYGIDYLKYSTEHVASYLYHSKYNNDELSFNLFVKYLF